MIERGRMRYTNVAIVLHWAIAALIGFNLVTGLTFAYMSEGLEHALVPFHISSGITVLALTIVRIAWRLTHRPPPMLPMAGWEKGLAHTAHFCLYLAMLGLPLTGWAMISAHASKPPSPGVSAPQPHQTLIWGVIPLPPITPIARLGDEPNGDAKLKAAHETFETRHYYGGLILLALWFLHVAGALKHQFVDRRRELARIGVGRAKMA